GAAAPGRARGGVAGRVGRGRTLLGLLVAVALFARLGTGTYRLLDTVLRADAGTRQQELRLRELSRAMAAFERDLRQALARPVRAPYGDPLAGVSSEERRGGKDCRCPGP